MTSQKKKDFIIYVFETTTEQFVYHVTAALITFVDINT